MSISGLHTYQNPTVTSPSSTPSQPFPTTSIESNLISPILQPLHFIPISFVQTNTKLKYLIFPYFSRSWTSFSSCLLDIMPPFLNMRRFSRSSSVHNPQAPQSPPTSFTPPLTHAPMMPNGTSGSHHDSHSRPVSANTSSSFDFANRPPQQYQMSALPSNVVSNLSRTDQIVLRHFWDVKHEENKTRDLHFVSDPCPIYMSFCTSC